ncbi:MAG: glycosyltransferase family A protein, partial [Candidatus Pacebacteria bacterium]|nr:glycosyltransferase family A protein [Candidatus Paceibacterota bacterium]
MKQSEQVPSLPLPESVDAMVESGEIEKAAKLARKGFDIWSHGPSLVRAGDLWVKAGDLIQAKDCYELFLLRCGQENTISKAVRSSLSSVNKKIKMSQKKSAVSNKQFSIIPSIIAKWGASLISFIKFDEAEKNKISVIMTTYNSKKFVGKAIESILSQTHSNLELVIVDDASTDGTFQILEAYSNKDSRIKLIKNFVNKGTYWSKNLGVVYSTGEFITIQDSDDISDKKRLELQLREFTKNSKIKVCSCNYVRIDVDGNIELNRGLKERLSLAYIMWKKDVVIKKLGFVDSVRTSADEEFFNRLKIVFSKEEFSHVNRPFIRALHRKDSLTTQKEGKVDIDSVRDENPDDLGFLSLPRRAYVKSYSKWHEKIKNGGESPYVSYPLLRRKFKAPESLHPSPEKHDEYVTASLASMQSRSGSLEKVIESILPQVDHLDVYLNGYGEIPS